MSESRARTSQPRNPLPRIETGPVGPPAPVGRGPWIQWAVSLSAHLAVLLLLGLTFFSVRPAVEPAFDATIVSGGPEGDPLGWSDQMGGLELPEPSPGLGRLTVEDAPVLTIAPFRPLVANAPASKGGGPGAGGGSGGDGFGETRFGPGTEKVRGVTVKTGDPQFTLLWDTQVDLDLHVTEPGGAQLFWKVKGKPTARGGMLDVDNVQGFGPENVFWIHGEGPSGEYRWYVEYYGGFGGYDQPTHWRVRIKQHGTEQVVEGRLRKIGEKSKVFTLKFAPGSGPGGPGD